MKDPETNTSSSVLLIGGPDAGKSNFLFRLWLSINEGKGTIASKGLPDEVEYLRAGSEMLLVGGFAGHTSKEVYVRVEVPIRSTSSGSTAQGLLVVPDLAGEQIVSVYSNRFWSRTWEELIGPGCSCLLFIRAGSDEIVAPLDWANCFEMYGAEKPGNDDRSGGNAGGSSEKPPEISPPTQVVLVDWLQFLRRAFTSRVHGTFRPRIGIVIAAWDAVPNDQQKLGPDPYLKDNFPLLHQFIHSNYTAFDFQEFGLSIVSGDLTNDEDFKARYLSGRPQDFGYVVYGISGKPVRTSDITVPVAWALGFPLQSP